VNSQVMDVGAASLYLAVAMGGMVLGLVAVLCCRYGCRALCGTVGGEAGYARVDGDA
jgi:hypothetical protein